MFDEGKDRERKKYVNKCCIAATTRYQTFATQSNQWFNRSDCYRGHRLSLTVECWRLMMVMVRWWCVSFRILITYISLPRCVHAFCPMWQWYHWQMLQNDTLGVLGCHHVHFCHSIQALVTKHDFHSNICVLLLFIHSLARTISFVHSFVSIGKCRFFVDAEHPC